MPIRRTCGSGACTRVVGAGGRSFSVVIGRYPAPSASAQRLPKAQRALPPPSAGEGGPAVRPDRVRGTRLQAEARPSCRAEAIPASLLPSPAPLIFLSIDSPPHPPSVHRQIPRPQRRRTSRFLSSPWSGRHGGQERSAAGRGAFCKGFAPVFVPPPDTSLIPRQLDSIVASVRPRRLIYVALDGAAPLAKMNQQRRFESDDFSSFPHLTSLLLRTQPSLSLRSREQLRAQPRRLRPQRHNSWHRFHAMAFS